MRLAWILDEVFRWMAELHRNEWLGHLKEILPPSPPLGPGGRTYIAGRKSVESGKTKTWLVFSIALGPVEGTHFHMWEHDVADE